MADVYISMGKLERTSSQLNSIVEEFENAVSSSEELESAIGQPFGRTELREKAQDFEERWDVKRDQLKDGLQDVQDHVEAIIESVTEFDIEAAIALETEE